MIRISPIPHEARPYQGQRAGLVTRAVAAVLDVLLALVAGIAGHLVFAGAKFLISPLNFQFPRVPVLLGVGGTMVLLAFYWAIAWAVTGRSYGAHVMGLRVVARHGGRPQVPIAFARAALSVIFPIGLLWCVASRKNRSLQDIVLRTSVVYDWSPRPVPAESAS